MHARTVCRTALALCACTIAGAAMSGELIYRPLIPSFGGNPNLSGHFISLAQIQNQHTPSNGGGGSAGIPQITFPPIMIDLGGTLPVVPEPPAEAAPVMSVEN